MSNSIFELAAGFFGQLRWERSSGQIFKPDPKTYTPESILCKWKDITDFKDKPFNKTQHPDQLSDYNDLIAKAKKLPSNDQGLVKINSLRDKVVIITGAGGGLGKSHALWFARYGAKVVVNDIKNPFSVVEEINKLYGEGTAISDTHDVVTEAQSIIDTATEKFKRVDILVNNAGILRDRSFLKMKDEEWFAVLKAVSYTHLDVYKRQVYSARKSSLETKVQNKKSEDLRLDDKNRSENYRRIETFSDEEDFNNTDNDHVDSFVNSSKKALVGFRDINSDFDGVSFNSDIEDAVQSTQTTKSAIYPSFYSNNSLYRNKGKEDLFRLVENEFPVKSLSDASSKLNKKGVKIKDTIRKLNKFKPYKETETLRNNTITAVSYTHLDVYKRQILKEWYCFLLRCFEER